MTSAITFPRFGFEITEKKKTLTALLMTVAVILMTLALSACPFTVDTVLADVSMLIETAGAIGAAVTAVSPVDSVIISNIAGIAETGLQAIQTAYDTYKASGAQTDLEKLRAAIIAIKTNLPQELAAAHITSQQAVQMATAWVGLITTTLTVILNLIPNLTAGAKLGASSIKAAQKSAGKIPNAASIKARWVWEVCAGDKTCSLPI